MSLHEHARPIAQALGMPVEFGYQAQMVDNDDDVVLDHNMRATRLKRRNWSCDAADDRKDRA